MQEAETSQHHRAETRGTCNPNKCKAGAAEAFKRMKRTEAASRQEKYFEEDAFEIAGFYVRNTIVAPFIYAVLIPLALLDLMATLYQNVAFRLWQIPRVPRHEYLIIDRQYLAYLNWVQKINCMYCGYATGVLAYVMEIASETEQYWCPIKHAQRIHATHHRYKDFAEYGEGDEIKEVFREQRAHLHENE